MNRSLDELTASELNAAIDDTNFPKALSSQCLSTAATATAAATITAVAATSQHVDEITIAHPQNGKPIVNANGCDENTGTDHAAHMDGQNANEPLSSNVQNGIKGFIKRAHPAPLKMVAFKGDSIDIPGTPKTPRTSTTPGKCYKIFYVSVYTIGNFAKMKFQTYISNLVIQIITMFSNFISINKFGKPSKYK